ncbi:unnamed protein product [Fusarium graminearum]|uniref:Uncharacterized protein n=1 Tax=Gibberella zeae TaxID=5518 RepID=A0A4E9EQ48_GIBZA|nr:unnamed protein product [Fusarium graminearum]
MEPDRVKTEYFGIEADTLKHALIELKRYHTTVEDGHLQRQKAIRECEAAVNVVEMMRARRLSQTEMYLGLQLAKTLSRQLMLEHMVVAYHQQWKRGPGRAGGDFSRVIAKLETRHRSLVDRQQSESRGRVDAIVMTFIISPTLTYHVNLQLSSTEVACVSVKEVLTAEGF